MTVFANYPQSIYHPVASNHISLLPPRDLKAECTGLPLWSEGIKVFESLCLMLHRHHVNTIIVTYRAKYHPACFTSNKQILKHLFVLIICVFHVLLRKTDFITRGFIMGADNLVYYYAMLLFSVGIQQCQSTSLECNIQIISVVNVRRSPAFTYAAKNHCIWCKTGQKQKKCELWKCFFFLAQASCVLYKSNHQCEDRLMTSFTVDFHQPAGLWLEQ